MSLSQLVGTQDGEPVVTIYDWAIFLSDHFCLVPRRKSYHHFCFSASHSKEVGLQECSNSPQSMFLMASNNAWKPKMTLLPLVNPPLDLSHQRKFCLYQEIREYCTDRHRILAHDQPHSVIGITYPRNQRIV